MHVTSDLVVFDLAVLRIRKCDPYDTIIICVYICYFVLDWAAGS